MEPHIKNLFEFTLMVMMGPNFRGVAVRQFLNLAWEFHAFEGMPVAREFRIFVKDNLVQCIHPYWFPSCMQRVDDEGWLLKLREIQKLAPHEVDLLTGYSVAVSRAVEKLGAKDNYWSLDFCVDKGGKWYLTDMAYGPDSYHYSSCQFAPEEMRERYPDPEDLTEATTVKQIEAKFARLKRLGDTA